MRYRFKYYNTTFKVLSYILIPVINVIIVSLIVGALTKILLFFGIDNIIHNHTMDSLYQDVIIYVSLAWNLVYIFFPKGVIVKENSLIIARYCITLRNFKFRIRVRFEDIESVNVNYNNLNLSKYYGAELVPLGDSNYNVELTLKNGKKLFFSIWDAEAFCQKFAEQIHK